MTMRINLSPLQMAVLAQVFARDAERLEERLQDSPSDQHTDVLQDRVNQAEALREAINAQLTDDDQRHIGYQVSNAA
jgi:hypothetical protein